MVLQRIALLLRICVVCARPCLLQNRQKIEVNRDKKPSRMIPGELARYSSKNKNKTTTPKQTRSPATSIEGLHREYIFRQNIDDNIHNQEVVTNQPVLRW